MVAVELQAENSTRSQATRSQATRSQATRSQSTVASQVTLERRRVTGKQLRFNWDEKDYAGGRNFGHLAFAVDDIYAVCDRLQSAGVTISRPPRDGHMAFVRTPDKISIELLQRGAPLPPREPWVSARNIGEW